MPQHAPLHPDDPELLGHYRLEGRLGAGGQGVVYLAQDGDGKYVAVKRLQTLSPQIRRRFAKEIAAARKVAPFCTARVLDADTEGDIPYVVSEYIEGRSLHQVLRTDGPLEGTDLHRLAIGIATALVAIHQAGVVHRDLKPANVLLAADGPRIVDFGIASAPDTEGTLTAEGQAIGTPAYMSPEQANGKRAEPASDIFAWASTIVAAATGKPPFGSDSVPAVLNRIGNEEPNLDGLSGPLRDLVRECLNKDPKARPDSLGVLLRLLGHADTDREATLANPAKVLTEAASTAAKATPTEVLPPSRETARNFLSKAGRAARLAGRLTHLAILVTLVVLITPRIWNEFFGGETVQNPVIDSSLAGTWEGTVEPQRFAIGDPGVFRLTLPLNGRSGQLVDSSGEDPCDVSLTLQSRTGQEWKFSGAAERRGCDLRTITVYLQPRQDGKLDVKGRIHFSGWQRVYNIIFGDVVGTGTRAAPG